MDYKQLGINIRNERKKQNLTIEELAFRADITPNYLGKIERAQTKLSLEVLINITNALGLTSDDILAHEFDNIPSKRIDILSNKISKISKSNKEYFELLEIIVSHFSKKD